MMNKKEEYKNKQPHTELADKMFARDPGSAPKTGERVPFVITQTGKGDRLWEKSEDPI
jgi:DNA polymerase delta subunit 1